MNDQLNFFQRQKLKKYLNGKLVRYVNGTISCNTYLDAPDYVKQDLNILKKLVKESINSLDQAPNKLIEIIERMFIEHKEFFDTDDLCYFIRFEMDRNNFEYIKYLNYAETKEVFKFGLGIKKECYKYFCMKFVEEMCFEIDSNFETNITDEGYNYFKYVNPNIQLNIIENKMDEFIDEDFERLIDISSDDTKIMFLDKHSDDIDKYIELSCFKDVKNEYINSHSEILLSHPKYIKNMSEEKQMMIYKENNNLFDYLDEKVQIKIICDDPTSISKTSIGFKKKFLQDINNIDIIKKCLAVDKSLYKYISYIETTYVDKEYQHNFFKSIDPTMLNDEELIDLFIHSEMLSAKGNLRDEEFSFYKGYSGDVYETTRGVDIYDNEQVSLIKKLSIDQIIKLINIDVNYVLPYLHFNESDDDYSNSKQKAKDIFKKMYPDKDLDDFDEIIDLVFDMQKSKFNRLNYNIHTGHSDDVNIPTESFKLLFNEKIMNSNSSLLINKYFKSLFTDEDSSEMFKEIIKNTYGEKAVKILEERKELDVYAINSLEIFDSRILDNFSDEFVNDLISYNIRDFSTFLNIIKNEEDLNLFKDYYTLLTKIMGKSVLVMQKAITEFYYNKNILKEIENISLDEKQINSLYIVLNSSNNMYDVNTIEDLDNLDKKINSVVSDKLDETNDAKVVKNIIFNYIFCRDYYNDSIKDYNTGVYNIDSLFELKHTIGIDFTSEEKFILNTIISLLDDTTDVTVLKSLAKKLLEEPFAKSPVLFNNLINKIMDYKMKNYNSRMIDDNLLENKSYVEEYDGVKIYILDGEDIFNNYYYLIGHSDANALGRDFMEHESQASMSTVSAREVHSMGRLIDWGPHYLFNNIEYEDVLAHASGLNNGDANVAHNPKVVKSTARSTNTPLYTPNKDSNNEFAFYRRIRNHDKRSVSNGRKKPSYICVYSDNTNWFSIEDIPKKDFEYAKKYDIPILFVRKCKYKAYTGRGY